MAGPSIVVRVLGDLTGLGSAMSGSAKTAESATSRIHSAFSSVLGTLNRTGVLGPFGDALTQIDQTFDSLSEHAKSAGAIMLGAGGAAVGIGAAFTALGSKEEAAHNQLVTAVTDSGHSWDQYAAQVDTAIKHQESFGNSSVQTQNALQTLTQATGNPTKALNLLSEAADLAAARHESLTTAASQLGKTYNGNTRLLKEFGIPLDSQNPLLALAAKLQGQAAAASDTVGGKIKALTTTVEDNAAAFGAKFGPAITAGGAAVTLVGGVVEAGGAILKTFTSATDDAAEAQKGLTAAVAASDVAEEANPIGLIIVAVVALGAAIALLVTHWQTVWSAMQAATSAVFNWVKANWPLLVDIIVGPLGIIATQVYAHWSDITATVKAAVNLIKGFFTGLWDGVTSAIGTVSSAVEATWSTIEADVRSAVNTVKGLFTGLWGGVTSGLAAAKTDVKNAWDAIVSTVSSVPGDVKKTLSGLWSGATGGLGDVSANIKSSLSGIVGAVKNIPGQIKGALSGLWGGATGGLGDVGAQIKKSLSGVVDTVKALPGEISGALGNLWGGASSGLSDLYHNINAQWNNIKGLVTGWPAQIAAWLGGMWDSIGDALHDAYRAVSSLWGSIIGLVRGWPAVVTGALGSMWHAIGDALRDAYGAVTAGWGNIIGLVRGWPGAVASYLGGLWSSIGSGLSSAYSTVSSWFDSLVGLARGLPGRISGAFGGMFDGIWEAFRSAINEVVSGWNSLHFTTPSFTIPVIGTHVGGITVGVPAIPYLAQGGLMTSSGLVFAHAGEVISPAPKSPRGGPAVQIDNLNLSNGLDVETFMKRAAWVAQTEAI